MLRQSCELSHITKLVRQVDLGRKSEIMTHKLTCFVDRITKNLCLQMIRNSLKPREAYYGGRITIMIRQGYPTRVW